LRSALGRAIDGTSSAADLELRAGYSAVADLADSDVEPTELVRRSASALDHLQFAGTADGLMSFDDVPIAHAGTPMHVHPPRADR
jgi:hypothetical protein